MMEFEVFDLGLIGFQKAWQFQKEVFKGIKNNLLKSALIICRHYPVITLGRQAEKKNILVSNSELEAKGIDLYEVERGGDITYHGPGQLTVYPLINLNYLKKDIHWFLRGLEEIIIDCLLDFGIHSQRRSGLTGVWMEEEKIASIGIAIRNWITFHGLSINVKKDDLANFRLIKPCGMDIKMTALEAVLNREIEIESVKDNFIHAWGRFLRVGTVLVGTVKSHFLLNRRHDHD